MLITIAYFFAENNSNFVNLPIITKLIKYESIKRGQKPQALKVSGGSYRINIKYV